MRFSRFLLPAGMVLACLGVHALAQPAAPQSAPQADVISNPFANDPAAPAAGKAVFEATCAACHGPGAAGSERAPALNTGTFRHGGGDPDLFQTIRSGVPGTLMPSFSGLPSDSVWRLVSYIKSLSGQTGPMGQATGDALAGEQVFFGKGGCAGCHEVNGRGLDLASDLSAAGTKPVAAIKTGVLHQMPPARGFGGAAHYADVVANDGRTVHGFVRGEDSFNILLETADGKWVSFNRKDVKSNTNAGGAIPRDIATRLSAKDVDDVVTYLQKQKERVFNQIA
jgi:putative heme-binding domain-containing protein